MTTPEEHLPDEPTPRSPEDQIAYLQAEVDRLELDLANAERLLGIEQEKVGFLKEVLDKAAELERDETTLTNFIIGSLIKDASTDSLTGLPNRRELNRVHEAIHKQCTSTETSYTLLVVDIDEFKPVNDRYGHDLGDEVLKRVAKVLKSATRSNEGDVVTKGRIPRNSESKPTPASTSDDIAARVGGDEFVVIVQNVKPQNLINRITEVYKNEFVELEEKVLQVHGFGISIGYAVYDPNNKEHSDKTPEEMLSLADQSMYEAKKAFKKKHSIHSTR